MKVVLHICCGVCAAGAVETLTKEGHEVVGFFYDPNIHPAEEYQRRLETTQRVARELNFCLEVPAYEPEEWLSQTSSLKDEPEGGRRCQVCYKLRLEKTYDYMADCGADAFTTTLTISPHKSAQIINKLGQEIGGEKFLVRDFKKKDGFKRAVQLARQWELYQQDYCGCIYSFKPSVRP
ncbi:MAG: epoxyqueuosine reductase QueH [Dehalococcoidia bacterium]|nr:epoxyqueuosine reductase QueH [Dehalococcoidia bacterium]